MANNYATPAQLFANYDQRTCLQLSGDQNTSQGNPTNIQFLLDMCASILDSALTGRYNLPLSTPVPLVLTWYVVTKTAARLYGRRSDLPKQIVADNQAADDWMKALIETGSVQLPGIPPAATPRLQDSNFPQGSSEFDGVFGTPVSPFGPTNTGGNVGKT